LSYYHQAHEQQDFDVLDEEIRQLDSLPTARAWYIAVQVVCQKKKNKNKKKKKSTRKSTRKRTKE